jgi:hypothetical protein
VVTLLGQLPKALAMAKSARSKVIRKASMASEVRAERKGAVSVERERSVCGGRSEEHSNELVYKAKRMCCARATSAIDRNCILLYACQSRSCFGYLQCFYWPCTCASYMLAEWLHCEL